MSAPCAGSPVPVILVDKAQARVAQADDSTQRILTRQKSNPKTAKGYRLSVESAILHFAPADLSGHEMCVYRSKGCTWACLNTAGRGRFTMTQQARIKKTKRFHAQRREFMAQLVREVNNLIKRAAKTGVQPALRLNGTSDFDFLTVPVERGGITYRNIFEAFGEVQFYDYTKVITRLRQAIPSNYHITFSLSEGNDRHAVEAIERGFNVAAVLRVAKKEAFPETWSGLRLIDGDEHDFRFLDPEGVIVGLRPKGKALKDTSGFVRDLDEVLDADRALNLGRAA